MAQINLTTTKPVKLKTQEKYCEEDIEIIPNLQDKTIKPTTEKQEVLVDEGYSGLNKVNVDPINVGSKTFTENGEYSAIDSGVDGWNKITIDVGGSAEVELPLPEIFYGKTIYWFKINNNELLLSASATTVGLWHYTISTGAMEQVYARGGYYGQFKHFGSEIFFCANSSSGTKGLYSYNTTTKEVTVLSEKQYSYFSADWSDVGNNQYIFVAYNLLGVFDFNTRRVVVEFVISGTYMTPSYLKGYTKVGEDYFTNTTINSAALYIYISSSNTFKKAEFNIINATYHKVGDNYIINNGLYLYNTTDKVVSRLTTTNGTSYKYLDFDNKTLIQSGQYVYSFDHINLTLSTIFSNFGSSLYVAKCGQSKAIITTNSSSYQGVRIFRSTDNTYSQISTTGYGFIVLISTKKGCLFCGNNNSYKGLFYVDEETESVTNKFGDATSSTFKVIVQNNFGIYFGNNSSATQGIYLFDEDTEEVVQKTTTGYGYAVNDYSSCSTLNGTLTSSSIGIMNYIDNTTGEVSEIYKPPSNVSWWKICLIDENKYYFASGGNHGILLIDLSTMSGERLYTTGYEMTICKKTATGVYFVCDFNTSSTDTKGILYYDYNVCNLIYEHGYYNVIKEVGLTEVVFEYEGTQTVGDYRQKVVFNPQTREKQIYYKLGEI